MANIFAQSFNSYAGPGNTITAEHDGFKLVATIHADDDSDPPWERDCGHGPVSDWRRKDSKRAGERILSEDRGSCRFYDFAEACKIALADGWGISVGADEILPPVAGAKPDGSLTRRQIAAQAALHDFRMLKAWCDDEWTYCGIDVRVWRHGVELVGKYEAALWGIELNYPQSKNAYLGDVAEEQAVEALALARANMTKLCRVPRAMRLLAPSRACLQALRTRLTSLVTRHRPATSTSPQGA